MIDTVYASRHIDEHGNIIGYTLASEGGDRIDVEPEELKRVLVEDKVTIINLKLTTDNRIIGRGQKEIMQIMGKRTTVVSGARQEESGRKLVNKMKQLIETYETKCEVLGIQPLDLRLSKMNQVEVVGLFRDTTNDITEEEYKRKFGQYPRNIVIPSFVTIVGERAFRGTLIEAVAGENILETGERSFENCKRLKEVYMPKVEIVGVTSFYNCMELVDINVESMKVAGDNSFQGCISLKNIKTPKLSRVGYRAFSACKLLEKIEAPLEFIGGFAFYQCDKLTNVTLNEVYVIGGYAFSTCDGLRRVNAPKLQEIGIGAFTGSKKLAEVNAPYLREVGQEAFAYCGELEKINAPNLMEIGNGAFMASGITQEYMEKQLDKELYRGLFRL